MKRSMIIPIGRAKPAILLLAALLLSAGGAAAADINDNAGTTGFSFLKLILKGFEFLRRPAEFFRYSLFPEAGLGLID